MGRRNSLAKHGKKAILTPVDHDEAFAHDWKEETEVFVALEYLFPDMLQIWVKKSYLEVLAWYATLYNGHLGRLPIDDYVLPIQPDYNPVHARLYSIARSQERKA